MNWKTASTLCLICMLLSVSMQLDEPPPATCLPNAVFVFTSTDPPAMQSALAQLAAAGGCSVHVLPPDAVIGGLPDAAETLLVAAGVIQKVARGLADEAEFSAISASAGQAAQAWNALYVAPEPPVEPPPGAEALVGDVRSVEPARDAPGRAAAAPPAPGTYDVSSFLYGKVAVGILYLESSGPPGDPQTENWSTARKDQVRLKIQAALKWYATTYPNANLSFIYDIQTRNTSYEPITRASTQDYLWINEVLGGMGYTQSTWYDRVHAYINALRSTNNADWGLAVFVVDSLADSDGRFSDNFFAYSTYLTGYNGFQIVMTYDNATWGIASMDSVMAHEFGHVFGAGDEYCQPGYACCWGNTLQGYLGVLNSGCEAGCDKPPANGVCDGNDSTPGSNCQGCGGTCVQPTCLMRTGSLVNGLCATSQAQMGLRDGDGDTRYDPVDTFPAFSFSADPPVYNAKTSLTWSGTATDAPWPSGTRTPVSINNITGVQIMANGGAWIPCIPADGAFNAPSEAFTCSLSGLGEGLYAVSIRATTRTNNTSLWADTAIVDITPPGNPTNVLPGCPAVNAIWQKTCPDAGFTWSGATDNLSGVAGYFYYWGPSSAGLGGSFLAAPQYDPPPVGDPADMYLRVQTVDQAGNLSPWTTLFNLKYDASPPTLPQLGSPSHSAGAWSQDATVDLAWSGAMDPGCGVGGYSLLWSQAPGGLPDTIQDTSALTATSLALADGSDWYASLRVQDMLGNWSPGAAQAGPFWIDTRPPTVTLQLDPGGLLLACAGDRLQLSWTGSDAMSGLAAYDLQYRSADGVWHDWLVQTSQQQAQFGPSDPLAPVSGASYGFRLRARDAAGNLGAYSPAAERVVRGWCAIWLPVIRR